MTSKKELEKKVSNIEDGTGGGNDQTVVDDLKENVAELEGKDPSEIEIEDEEHPIYELISRMHEAMKES